MRRKKVLLIDDDVSYLKVMQKILGRKGFRTECFSEWRATTIQEIITIAPDYILLDEYLIGVRGSFLCTILKSVNELRQTPILLISSMDGLEKVAAKSLADGYLNKPIEILKFEKYLQCFNQGI